MRALRRELVLDWRSGSSLPDLLRRILDAEGPHDKDFLVRSLLSSLLGVYQSKRREALPVWRKRRRQLQIEANRMQIWN